MKAQTDKGTDRRGHMQTGGLTGVAQTDGDTNRRGHRQMGTPGYIEPGAFTDGGTDRRRHIQTGAQTVAQTNWD